MPLTGRFAIGSDAELRQFEENIRALVEAGHAARAQAILHQAALANDYDALGALIDPASSEADLRGWDEVLGDCTESLDRADGPVTLELRLVARSHSSPDDEQGLIRRYMQYGDEAPRLLSAEPESATRLTGLDALFAFIRDTGSDDFPDNVQRTIASWSIVAIFVRTVATMVDHNPLPKGASIRLWPDFTVRSMESGYLDLLPGFSREWTPQSQLPPNAAAQIAAERKASNLAQFQGEWIRTVAEMREIHRLLQYFPFHKALRRRNSARLWETRMEVHAQMGGLGESLRVPWTIPARDLTALWRSILAERQVPDIDDTLDPKHVDALHERYVAVIGANNFRMQPGISLFEIELTAALTVGGAWVRVRWQDAKPYAEEMGLAG